MSIEPEIKRLCASAADLAMEDRLNDPSDEDILIYAAEAIDSKIDYDKVDSTSKLRIIGSYFNAEGRAKRHRDQRSGRQAPRSRSKRALPCSHRPVPRNAVHYE